MDAADAQQWATDLPPYFVLPRKPLYPLLPPRLFETPGVMDSPDWAVRPLPLRPARDYVDHRQGVFKFEGDAGPYGRSALADIFATDAHATWDFSTSRQPRHLPPAGSDGQAPQPPYLSSLPTFANHKNGASHIQGNAWPPSTSENIPGAAYQSCFGPAFQQPSFAQCPATAVPSVLQASYSAGSVPCALQMSNTLAYDKPSSPDSPMVAPRTLHDGSWDMFNPLNQYPNISTQSFLPSQTSFTTPFHGLPLSTQALSAEPLGQNTQGQSALLEDSYTVSPAWPEWQPYGSSGFSSESEMASPVSPAGLADAQTAGFGNQSFCSSVDSNMAPLPALTFSQASPASDWEDISSNHHHTGSSGEGGGGDSQFGTLAAARGAAQPGTWKGPAKEDGYTKINGKRVKKDDILVQWKKAGMSYRQIREKGGFAEAESTLRGRFRTLTKNREERVRKPLWMAKDIHLLREGVKVLMVGSLYPGTEASDIDVDEMDVDANKVPWKKVAEYILEHGGSYHFGNATCKKQWLKIQGLL